AYAECDRMEGSLSDEEASAVVASASEIVEEVAASIAGAAAAPAEAVPEGERVRVLGHPARSDADALALRMLEHELGSGSVALEVGGRPLLTSELVQLVREGGYAAVCIADL